MERRNVKRKGVDIGSQSVHFAYAIFVCDTNDKYLHILHNQVDQTL